ncbi:hypothetical protein BH10CYA1_BH10CYA1_56940 [soil metagenome]
MIEATNKDLDTETTIVSELRSSEKSPQSTLERIIASPYLHLGVLLLIVGLCFGRTLTSYFLADDFGEVSYVSRIFNGEPQLFWSNFTGNYMQIPGMNVYRPWLLVSLVMDFLLYKANATGYYFTNLSCFTGVVFLIYFVSRQLTSGWSSARSAVAAFFGAALFAASPLRCESVSWVVGRVDIVCCFFYLSSYLLFLKGCASSAAAVSKGKQTTYTVLGVAAFFLAMGTKEMAIGLPALLAITAYFGIGEQDRARSVGAKLKDAALFSAPLWVSAVFYLIIRYACLGTLGGGYVAGFGDSQIAFMVQRWMDFDTIKRLFFPFCRSLFSGQFVYGELLTVCYGALAGLTLIRLAEKKLSMQWFLFLAGWLVTAAVPIFQLWGLGLDLEGSRFYFFLSIPLCLMAPILLFRPTSPSRTSSELKLLVASAVTLTAITCILGRVASLTDLEWVHAGKENKQVSIESIKLAESHKIGLIPILGIPKERSGAHQILNGSTFGTMLRPPFTSTDLSQRFATFDPIMFGPPEFIDASRFKSVLQNSNGDFFVWSTAKSNFDKLNLNLAYRPVGAVELPTANGLTGWLPHAHSRAAYSLHDGAVEMTAMQEGDSVQIGGLKVNPLAADFIQFDYKASGVPEVGQVTVYASGAKPTESQAVAPMKNSDSFQTVRVRLSHYWSWFCQGDISALSVQPYPCSKVVMRNFQLLSANLVCPTLTLLNGKADGAGIYRIDGENVTVNLDAREVKGAARFEVEVGKVNYFFNNFEKVTTSSPVAAAVRTKLSAPQIQIDAKNFAVPGFYELRARCLDVDGKPIGEYSDILTLRIGQPQ